MSKPYKGQTCAYCAKPGASTTGDHVFGRGFFPISERENLPKVPTCDSCNGLKSHLEHYLMTTLPFGGVHADAHEMLNEYVPGRLDQNQKLLKELAAGRSYGRVGLDGVVVAALGLPFDSEKLSELFVYIAKGLAFHHWGHALPADCHVRAGMINPKVEPEFERLLAFNGQRVKGSVGHGAFEYEGLQSVQDAHVTFWKFSVYGGVKFGGDPDVPGEIPGRVWVTSSRSDSVLRLYAT